MMGFVLLALAVVSPPVVWYGPARVSFDLTVDGSPYDAQASDVRVEFSAGANRESRLAYFDGTKWNAVLLSRKPGRYRAVVKLNGKTVRTLDQRLELPKSARAFVRVGPDRRTFVSDDAKPYWPIGHNLGWQDNRIALKLPEQLREMGRNGLNWARIWACSWDGKNPYVAEGLPVPKGRDMIPEVFAKWDAIVQAASESGVRFQLVLFHHGSFSSRTDANWPGHPWNAKNGGFLPTAEEFFTHPEAVARAKNWLRYAVARWAHEPAILAWELFNEVEWVDAFASNRGDTVGKWHDDMADFLRSIDPYGHLVVTSSGANLPIWRKMDFHQPHGYPPDIRALVLGTPPAKDRPFFFGEVGLGGGPRTASSERTAVRGALWSSLMAGHSGAAQYWYWDRVVLDKLYPDFERFAKFLAAHQLPGNPLPKPAELEVASRQAGAVRFAPGQGWAKTTRFAFSMPGDAASGALGSLSSFIQGPGKRDMMAEPIRFTFDAGQAGAFELQVSTIARMGANVKLSLDGQVVVDENFEPQEKDRDLNRSFTVPFGAGKHTVTLSNDGPDWFVVGGIRIDGIGRAVSAQASVAGKRLILRLANEADSEREAFDLGMAGIKDGEYHLDELDLDSGQTKTGTVRIIAGRLSGVLNSRESIWLLTPK